MYRVKLSVKRCKNADSKSYQKEYDIECTSESSVSQLLELVNETEDNPIEWECSCRQNMCGACAMIINGIPKLACATFVKDFAKNSDSRIDIYLEPLSKFPLICDLKVDRSIIYEYLENARLWIEEQAKINKKEYAYEYLSATCLMCGCCYEVCPNYSPQGTFEGAGVMNTAYRVVNQTKSKDKKKQLKKDYRKNGMDKCSRSLACERVCPAGIPLSVTMSRLNSKFLI